MIYWLLEQPEWDDRIPVALRSSSHSIMMEVERPIYRPLNLNKASLVKPGK